MLGIFFYFGAFGITDILSRLDPARAYLSSDGI
jgi:hypothetical protein